MTVLMRVFVCGLVLKAAKYNHRFQTCQSRPQRAKLVRLSCQSWDHLAPQDQASDNNLWTEFKLLTYRKKQTKRAPCFSRIFTAKVLFRAWQSCCQEQSLHCRHSTDLPLVCVMLEGNKAVKMSGCALQESITVSFFTGKLKLQMT